MNSPYRAHPALPLKADVKASVSALAEARPDAKTIPFPKPAPPPVGRARPATQAGEGQNRLGLLLKLEGEMRQLPTRQAIAFHAVNESRALLGHAQAFLFGRNRRDAFTLESVSDIAQPDIRAPFLAALASAINRLQAPEKRISFDLQRVLKSDAAKHAQALWLPFPDAKGKAFGGLLLLRDDPWTDDLLPVADRLAGAYAHAIRATTPPTVLRNLSLPRWALFGLPVLAALLAFMPVPLTTLAPFEVVPLDATPVTAPIDGVISAITVDPNTPVRAGQDLFRFDATNQTAALAIAQQNVLVAQAKFATIQNGAFGDADMKRSLAIAEQELELARAELVNAEDQMRRTTVSAAADGVAVFASRSELSGRPVRVGERVMEIADPAKVAYRIEVGIHDAIALGQGASVRLFLDADPLNPRAGAIYEESYHAVETEAGPLAFIVKARPAEGSAPVRLGLRGTAQLSGQTVSLGFYLFRRPIAALRQHFGF